ncbi:MAG: hypothetical protein WAW26_22630 [Anaerolineae bacterium]
MTTLSEGNLLLTIPDTGQARKFDDSANHRLTHCMKAVDFIVELTDRYLFIEVKDPQNPLAHTKERDKFIQEFLAGQGDQELIYKYRDSFLYEWASGRVAKPILYLVLIAIDSLTEVELLTRTDDLKRKLPMLGPTAQPWIRPLVSGCAVFNIAAWNRSLPDYPIARSKP